MALISAAVKPHRQAPGERRVACKRHVGHARAMLGARFLWLACILHRSRRDRTRLAQLDHTRAGMVMIAELLRDLSARHDAHVHAIQQAARASHGALTEPGAVNSIRNVFLTQATDAAIRSRQTAEALDGAVEALERLTAALRGG